VKSATVIGDKRIEDSIGVNERKQLDGGFSIVVCLFWKWVHAETGFGVGFGV
jgi:hypothetical protein